MASKKPRGKRPKTQSTFGAPTEDDSNPQRLVTTDITSAAPSTRGLASATVPTLAALCMRIFAQHFVRLRNNEKQWAHLERQLRLVPDPLIPKIFAALRVQCPTYLKHEFIVTFLFRGPSITLTSALPGVQKGTLLSIPRLAPNLVELELDGFSSIIDAVFSTVFQGLKSLQIAVLRGCTQVGSQTITAISESCPCLRVINLNYTSVTPTAVLRLLLSHPKLEVLKLAGLRNWTDATLARLIGELKNANFPMLHTLKLRQLAISDSSLVTLIHACPNLKRLDVSFTGIRHCAIVLDPPELGLNLEKLSIGSTGAEITELLVVIPILTKLRVLSISALGSSGAAAGGVLLLTLNDDSLRLLTAALEGLNFLEDINLACNAKLCKDSVIAGSAMRDFLFHTGRKCKRLNFAGIPHLRSSDLEGLVANDPPALEHLNLSNTSVDDDIASFVSSCHSLKALNLSGTKITRDGVLPIIEACPELTSLDLTSCRGIKVVERRRFFEVWKEERGQ